MKKWSVLSVLGAALLVTSGAFAGPLADATSDSLWGIELGGYLQASYTYQFNSPNVDANSIVGRPFSTDNDEIQLNAFQLYIDKLPEDEGEAGFRFDILAGEDSAVIGDLWGGDDDIAIYQAYISYIAPMGNGLTIDVGRFSTWHGYESIESPANDQFTRGMMFGMMQPYTHTGVRLTYPINDMWELSGGMTQGWDVVNDNNDGWTFHAAVRWMPMETVYIQNSVSYGPEMFLNDSDDTLLYDLVATWEINESWTLGGNFDYENIEDVAVGGGDATLLGIAGFLRYDVNEDLYLAARLEWIDDDDNFITAGDDMWEVTLTMGYQVTEGLMTRLEYRHDDADAPIFADEDFTTDDSQDTISVEVIYSF